jgi:hypothetical protein
LASASLVVGASVKSNIASTMERAVLADYIVTTQTEEVDFPITLATKLEAARVVDSVTGFRYVEARVGEDVDDVVAADFTQVGALLDLDMQVVDATRQRHTQSSWQVTMPHLLDSWSEMS